jgi:hypothetical protein
MGISAAEMLRRTKPITSIVYLRGVAYDGIKKHEETLRLIKEKEYMVGDIHSDGTKSYYSDKSKYLDVYKGYYWKFKHNLNPIPGQFVVDLMLKGNFISSFYLPKPKLNKYTWNARDKKKNKLIGQYDDIMGLRQESFEDFQIKYVYDEMLKTLKRKLGQ